MTTLYRIKKSGSDGIIAGVHISAFIGDDVLVPVQPCSHGNYARHIIGESIGWLVDEPAYREPDDCTHRELSGSICVECGAGLRWVRQFWPEATE